MSKKFLAVTLFAVLAATLAPQAADAAPSLPGIRLIPAAATTTTDAYLIQSVQSGRCWDADPAGISSNGTALRLEDCDVNADNQAFYVIQNGSVLQFQSYESGRYVDVSPSDNTTIRLWDQDNQPNQKWVAEAKTSDQSKLRTQLGGSRYLTADGSGANGTPLRLRNGVNGAQNQLWHL